MLASVSGVLMWISSCDRGGTVTHSRTSWVYLAAEGEIRLADVHEADEGTVAHVGRDEAVIADSDIDREDIQADAEGGKRYWPGQQSLCLPGRSGRQRERRGGVGSVPPVI